jgi:hypothetical protein
VCFAQARRGWDVWHKAVISQTRLIPLDPAVHAAPSRIGTRSFVRTTPKIKGATVPAAATGRTSSHNNRCPIDESVKPRLVSAEFYGIAVGATTRLRPCRGVLRRRVRRGRVRRSFLGNTSREALRAPGPLDPVWPRSSDTR